MGMNCTIGAKANVVVIVELWCVSAFLQLGGRHACWRLSLLTLLMQLLSAVVVVFWSCGVTICGGVAISVAAGGSLLFVSTMSVIVFVRVQILHRH